MSVDRLLADLIRRRPNIELLRDPEQRLAYAGDASEVEPCLPQAAVRAHHPEDVEALLQLAAHHRVPLTPRGGGTSRVGGAVPVQGGIVLALETLNRCLSIDPQSMIAVVQPGMITADFRAAVAEAGLFYPPDPSSLNTCTLGGNVAANAGGPSTYKYGSTRDHILGMQVVNGEGQLLSLGKRTRKGVTGYDLCALMVGSEGTLGVMTELTVKLLRQPQAVATMLVFLDDAAAIQRAIHASWCAGVSPRCIELVDRLALQLLRQAQPQLIPSEARAMLIVEYDGPEYGLAQHLDLCGNAMTDAGATQVQLARDPESRAALWQARRQLSYTLRAAARFKLSEDIVVPTPRIADTLTLCEQLAERFGLRMPTYGHAGDGNLHVNILWNDPAEQENVQAAIRALFEQVIAWEGTLSGEHGLGVLKAPYLPLEQSASLIDLQKRIKDLCDPQGILNPGKVFPDAAHRFHGIC